MANPPLFKESAPATGGAQPPASQDPMIAIMNHRSPRLTNDEFENLRRSVRSQVSIPTGSGSAMQGTFQIASTFQSLSRGLQERAMALSGSIPNLYSQIEPDLKEMAAISTELQSSTDAEERKGLIRAWSDLNKKIKGTLSTNRAFDTTLNRYIDQAEQAASSALQLQNRAARTDLSVARNTDRANRVRATSGDRTDAEIARLEAREATSETRRANAEVKQAKLGSEYYRAELEAQLYATDPITRNAIVDRTRLEAAAEAERERSQFAQYAARTARYEAEANYRPRVDGSRYEAQIARNEASTTQYVMKRDGYLMGHINKTIDDRYGKSKSPMMGNLSRIFGGAPNRGGSVIDLFRGGTEKIVTADMFERMYGVSGRNFSRQEMQHALFNAGRGSLTAPPQYGYSPQYASSDYSGGSQYPFLRN